ncbi:MAG: hypothetical protein UX91_C0008G0012 [Candidatus Amesbacteria bacterium GW2011_GWB1_47_19]|nr:MAG: hypothetical protein UW51_C0002G0263 [Candidatus Amesbacteria bacterium GW2011_GWA1_44_24]KKU31042.1 MAG: hypothetical protein UX46_C0008G0062 [Candidatus Amesbacteria bacterium GW2011_GWC1_46_24]KKU66658.1 MAG: hypothetical protein UX91_C0008G0012 [Candidatus Amesbacteria bacterium GW2011_GWB1_47_19]OGD06141.1 MAG: hypothetical protein A2379_03555 [Candidatus Amesbacteria bacterium RIFOXYB1_FULL_47_13]HBC72263.1 hypothetical protein [Candidatus Amesbacteria bacterium]
MSELAQSKGIFSGDNLPIGWKDQRSKLDSYLHHLSVVCPDMKLIGQITRGANSTTFVLKGADGLCICQFSGSLKVNLNFNNPFFQEDQSAYKFRGVKERMAYLRSQNIAVPEVFSTGTVIVDDNQEEFVIMNFVKGISVDSFLSSHPHKRQQVYERVGVLLAQLQSVQLLESHSSANDLVMRKVENASTYLVRNQILASEHGRQLMGVLSRRVDQLGDFQTTYVHLDPTPVNMQVTGSIDNYVLTLLDVEAINPGHPLIDGLGRSIKWGIHDWNYVSGGELTSVSSTVDAFLRGYSQFVPEATKYIIEPELLQPLMVTTELVLLPLSIMKENMKEEPGEYYDWSKNRLLQLIEGCE